MTIAWFHVPVVLGIAFSDASRGPSGLSIWSGGEGFKTKRAKWPPPCQWLGVVGDVTRFLPPPERWSLSNVENLGAMLHDTHTHDADCLPCRLTRRTAPGPTQSVSQLGVGVAGVYPQPPQRLSVEADVASVYRCKWCHWAVSVLLTSVHTHTHTPTQARHTRTHAPLCFCDIVNTNKLLSVCPCSGR